MYFDPTPALKFYEKSEVYRDYNSGCSVCMLMFVPPEGDPIEMGQVAIRSDKTYWWFTTNPKIMCKHTAGARYKYEKAACKDLQDYVCSEIIRLNNLKTPVIYQNLDPVELRKSDRNACREYRCNEDDFTQGMDWAFRTMGIPRRPHWAKFIVQNRDLTFVWYEHEPEYDHNKGSWHCKHGRSMVLVLDEECLVGNWKTSIKRIR